MAPDSDVGNTTEAPSAERGLQHSDQVHGGPGHSGLLRNGLVLGLVSAVGYSLTNLALRQLSDSKAAGGDGWDLWVTAMKTLPTACIAWVLVLRRVVRGQPAFPPLALLPALLFLALLMQFGGNFAFQVALSYLGLGITVPFVFACIICVGAIAGRVVLGDSISTQVVAAMAVMMAAIVLLSAGTMSPETPGAGESADSSGHVLTGILVASVSGCSYGLVGVLIRSFVRSKLSVESTLIVLSTVGATVLGTLGVTSSGWQAIEQTTATEWPAMLVAGISNAVAFFAIAHALRRIDVNHMNVINASQNAMCAVGAVLLFQEPLNALALSGIGLTIAGLLLLGWKRASS